MPETRKLGVSDAWNRPIIYFFPVQRASGAKVFACNSSNNQRRHFLLFFLFMQIICFRFDFVCLYFHEQHDFVAILRALHKVMGAFIVHLRGQGSEQGI